MKKYRLIKGFFAPSNQVSIDVRFIHAGAIFELNKDHYCIKGERQTWYDLNSVENNPEYFEEIK